MTIEEMQNKLDELKESIDNALSEVARYEELIQQIKEQEEPKFERREGKLYFWVSTNNGKAECIATTDNAGVYDKPWYDNNNYFYTKERAQEVTDKINFLLKLERLHDIYCPDYVPDWYDFKTEKWYVLFDNSAGGYDVGSVSWAQNKTNVYFPTEEIAQKVCDILNAEKDGESK